MEEIDVMQSIYGDEWKMEGDRRYNLGMKEKGREIILFFRLPIGYPSDSPPTVEMSGPSLTRSQKEEIYEALNNIYLENIGEIVLYQWVEKVREMLQDLPSAADQKISRNNNNNSNIELQSVPSPEIIHGDIIEDGKSVFQAHIARITDPADVQAVLWNLKLERKIASATHNIVAWKCGSMFDCDDDGERSAGGRLMRLLDLANAQNVVVVVTRWYGGVHLGNDRFRRINEAARQTLLKAKVISR